MIAKIFNLIFGCHHRRLTRPITPVHNAATQKCDRSGKGTYVACLDCGQRFQYDVEKMRVGRQIDDHGSVPARPAAP